MADGHEPRGPVAWEDLWHGGTFPLPLLWLRQCRWTWCPMHLCTSCTCTCIGGLKMLMTSYRRAMRSVSIHRINYLHSFDFCYVNWFQCIQSTNSSLQCWYCFSEISFTFIFDILSRCSCFIRD